MRSGSEEWQLDVAAGVRRVRKGAPRAGQQVPVPSSRPSQPGWCISSSRPAGRPCLPQLNTLRGFT